MPPHLGEGRRARSRRPARSRRARALGSAVALPAPSARATMTVRLCDDDVVHLAGDAGALGRRGQLRLLVALDERLPGPVDQGLEVAAPVADVDTDEGADERAVTMPERRRSRRRTARAGRAVAEECAGGDARRAATPKPIQARPADR